MILILAAVLIITLIYFKVIKLYAYWTDRGVKQRKQTYLFGDNASVFFRKESFWDMTLNFYNTFPEERYVGFYQMTRPILIVKDSDLIKQICVKDFDHFVDHVQFMPDGLDELFNKSLFALKGNRWRDMRSTLSPSFTSSKMRIIFNLVSECATDFTNYFLETGGTHSVELKEIFTRYTNDVIATVAFGVSCDSMKDRENEFYLMGKEATLLTTGFWQNLKIATIMTSPRLAKLLRLNFLPKSVRIFFSNIIKEAVTSREKLGIVRPDMLQLLIEARHGRQNQEEKGILTDGFDTVQESNLTSSNNKIPKQEITYDDITAQALAFFFAGFESVSTLICFTGHELVENLAVQRKLQNEIDETFIECRGKLTYEVLLKMKYMDMVVSEVLRKWPIAVITDRVCTKPYTIQPTKPTEKPINLQKGDLIWIFASGIHRDSKHYPDPDRFDPERFNDENKGNINPYTYMPFGVGPRSCIANRFALLECKTVIFHLLSKFDFVEVERTSIPLKLSKKSINLSVENGFWIGLKPRTNIS